MPARSRWSVRARRICRWSKRPGGAWRSSASRHPVYADVGVAGLWRLLSVAEELARYRVLIAVAGMEGALFSALAGLVPGLVIAVPSPVGYGVSRDGAAALTSALASCAPGIVTVNVGNGFGAAAAARKALGMHRVAAVARLSAAVSAG